MTERNPALWIQARGDHTAEQDRQLMRLLLGAHASQNNSGVCGIGDLIVTASTGMTVNVSAGGALIKCTESTHGGFYGVYNDGVVNLAVTAAHATLGRKDIVVARVQDQQYSGASNLWSLAVVAGTPSASPAEPALPANSLKLATLNVTAAIVTIPPGNITTYRRLFASINARVMSEGLLPGLTISQPVGLMAGNLLSIENSAGSEIAGFDGSGNVNAPNISNPWISYTPTWGASGVAPAVNNGSLTGAYRLVGKTLDFRVVLTFGSTTSTGTGNYKFGISPGPSFAFPINQPCGSAFVRDASASTNYLRTACTLNTGEIQLMDAAGAVVGASTPFVTTTSDEIKITGRIELA